MGFSVAEPTLRVEDRSGEQVTYAKGTPTAARRIVVEHLAGDKVVEGFAVGKVKVPLEGK